MILRVTFEMGRSEVGAEGVGLAEEEDVRNTLSHDTWVSSEAIWEVIVESTSDFTRPRQWWKM